MAKTNRKQTSPAVASDAAKLLTRKSSSKRVKRVAGSALSQTRPSKKRK